MPAPSDNASTGKAGSISFKGPGAPAGGTRYNIPMSRFNVQTVRGDSIIPLINNVGFDANRVLGISVAQFDCMIPFNPLITPAAFWAAAFLTPLADTGTANQWQATVYPDNASSVAANFQGIKFGSWGGSVSFSTNGAAQVAAMRCSGISIDPYHGTPLTVPSAGALATSGILGFAQSSYTGASVVVGVSWNINTGLQIVPGVTAGGNSTYPYIASGIIQQTVAGTVSITQLRSAMTVLGSTGGTGSLVVTLGGAADGMTITFMLMPLSLGQPSDMGINYMNSTYALLSTNGTSSPCQVADL